MNNTLSNWTLHSQNLGDMLRNYRQQYRHLRADQWKELGHFFNTASNMLDTIGRMTESAILRLVKYNDDDDNGGGGMGGRQSNINNNELMDMLTPTVGDFVTPLDLEDKFNDIDKGTIDDINKECYQLGQQLINKHSSICHESNCLGGICTQWLTQQVVHCIIPSCCNSAFFQLK